MSTLLKKDSLDRHNACRLLLQDHGDKKQKQKKQQQHMNNNNVKALTLKPYEIDVNRFKLGVVSL